MCSTVDPVFTGAVRPYFDTFRIRVIQSGPLQGFEGASDFRNCQQRGHLHCRVSQEQGLCRSAPRPCPFPGALGPCLRSISASPRQGSVGEEITPCPLWLCVPSIFRPVRATFCRQRRSFRGHSATPLTLPATRGTAPIFLIFFLTSLAGIAISEICIYCITIAYIAINPG